MFMMLFYNAMYISIFKTDFFLKESSFQKTKSFIYQGTTDVICYIIFVAYENRIACVKISNKLETHGFHELFLIKSMTV